MNDCIFCKIINKEIPAKIEFESEKIIVFHDINPKAPVHLLIVPKKHIGNVSDLSEIDKSLGGELLFTAKKMAEKFGISASGYRLVVNNGKGAGQEVPHLHIHLLGGRRMDF